jgi:hypothetical protein
MLSEDEGKVERELFVVREADEEGGWAVAVRRRLGVLQMVFSMASHTGAPETERPYLDVVNHTFVAKVSPCAIASCGKGIGRDIQERATAGIADVECSNRDWRRVSMRHNRRSEGGLMGHTSRLVAQIQGVVLASLAVDCPHAKG